MKKLLTLLAIVFTVFLFTSCEKSESELLSDFIIGKWASQTIGMSDDGQDDFVKFYVDIEEDEYTLSLVPVGEGGVLYWDDILNLPTAGYTITEDMNRITIDEPQFPGDEPSDNVVSFSVDWEVGGDTMTWEPVIGNDAPTIIWTRDTER